jgi:hypothetical protein
MVLDAGFRCFHAEKVSRGGSPPEDGAAISAGADVERARWRAIDDTDFLKAAARPERRFPKHS